MPSEDPIAESVLEWTIMRDSRDIRQLMVWLEESEGRKERSVFMSRACLLYTSPSPRDS